jgi:hypothetical protein
MIGVGMVALLVLASGATDTMPNSFPLEIVAQANGAVHEHGGAPAKIGSVRFSVKNSSETPQVLEATQAIYFVGLGTKELKEKSRPEVSGLVHTDDPHVEWKPVPQLTIPPHATWQFSVYFEPVEAYQNINDYFAIDIAFHAAGQSLTVRAPIDVARIDPVKPRR